MKLSLLIVPDHLLLIKKLNNGVAMIPNFVEECMTLRPSYFVWDDSDDTTEIIDREAWLKKYDIRTGVHSFTVVER
jgi:hypothetical protein